MSTASNTTTGYKRIIAAIDLSEESRPVLQRARMLADADGAELHIAHAIETLGLAYGGDIPMDFSDIQTELQNQATQRLNSFAEEYRVSEGHQHLLSGRPEQQIQQLAEQLDVNLVVVGSHGSHGLALLLGSTVHGMLHGACCDVLAVKI